MPALLLILIMTTLAASQPKVVSTAHSEHKNLGINAGLSADGLDGLSENQKLEILFLLDSAKVHVTSLEGKKWPHRKQTYIAVGSDSLKSIEKYQFRIFAFDLSGPKIRLLAMSAEPEMLDKGEELIGFDFAAYQINSQEYSFGIRYSLHRSYAGGGEASLKGILMYRIQAPNLHQILAMTTSLDADLAGDWNEDGTRDRNGSSVNAVIIVTKHKTNGYYDWVIKADNGKKAPLIWDGSSYEMKGEDPFPTGDFDIFNSEE